MEKQIRQEAFAEVEIFAAVAPHLADYEGFTELTLGFSRLSIDADATELAAALEQLQLKELDVILSSNSITNSGALELAAALGQLQQLTKLELRLDSNGIGDAGAVALAEAAWHLPHLEWVEVQLWDNRLGAEGRAAWERLEEELQSRGVREVYIEMRAPIDHIVDWDG